MISEYIWHSELGRGEVPRAIITATGNIIELNEIKPKTLMKFPSCRGIQQTFEVVLLAETRLEYRVETCRRAQDGIGIELINRGQAGRNWQGIPGHTINGPNDVLDKFLTKGKGYQELDVLLKKYGM